MSTTFVIEKSPLSHTDSLANLPYFHNLNIPQLFSSCRANLERIQQVLSLTSHNVVQRRFEAVDEILKTVENHFATHNHVSDQSLYLLLSMLDKLYDLTHN